MTKQVKTGDAVFVWLDGDWFPGTVVDVYDGGSTLYVATAEFGTDEWADFEVAVKDAETGAMTTLGDA